MQVLYGINKDRSTMFSSIANYHRYQCHGGLVFREIRTAPETSCITMVGGIVLRQGIRNDMSV